MSDVRNLLELVASVDQYYPISQRISHFLGIEDIINLTRTSRDLSGLYTSLLKTQWNINTRLRRFFRDPTAFRNLQAQTECLLVGFFAFNFFHRQVSLYSGRYRLEIVVREGSSAEPIFTYLEKEGYRRLYSTGRAIREDNTDDVELVNQTLFIRTATVDQRNILIMVKEVTSSPIHAYLKSLTFTHWTCVITWNKAYCLFPQQTIIRRESYFLRDPEGEEWSLRSNLLSLSEDDMTPMLLHWDHSYYLSDRPADGYTLTCPRRVGDQHSWIIGLDTNGVTQAPHASYDAAFMRAGFCLKLVKNQAKSFYVMDMDLLTSRILRQTYSLALPAFSDSVFKFWSDLKCQIAALTLVQLQLLPREERPQNWSRIKISPLDIEKLLHEVNFQMPEVRTFYDDKVIEFLDRHVTELGLGNRSELESDIKWD